MAHTTPPGVLASAPAGFNAVSRQVPKGMVGGAHHTTFRLRPGFLRGVFLVSVPRLAPASLKCVDRVARVVPRCWPLVGGLFGSFSGLNWDILSLNREVLLRFIFPGTARPPDIQSGR